MSVYSYPQSKVIDEVAFRKSEGGHTRAYLHAHAGADGKTLYDIICRLRDQGWQCVPYSIEGKPALEVEGFKQPADLTALLQNNQWVTGSPIYAKGKEDKLSLKDKIKKRSLAASGAFYLVGDASFATYGYKGGSALNTIAGGLYGAGTLSLLTGGRKDPSDLQVRDISRRLAQYLKEHGEALPQECSLDSIVADHDKGLIQKADDLLRRYPSELMNLFFAAAGICIASSAYKSNIKGTAAAHEIEEVFQRKLEKFTKSLPKTQLAKADLTHMRAEVEHSVHLNHRREGWLDIGLGSMTSLSGLFAMMVKEKAPDPDAPKKEGMGAVWEYVQKKPLAIAGVGYMVSTMCHAVSTAIAWNHASNDKRKSVKFRANFIVMNLIAELLLAISSKGHGEGVKSDKSVDNTVLSLAAELIAKQPVKLQDELIQHVTRFLGRPDVLALKDDEAGRILRQQVEAMRQNPWAMAAPAAGKAPEPAAPAPEAKKSAASAWQARLADAAAQSQPQPQLSV